MHEHKWKEVTFQDGSKGNIMVCDPKECPEMRTIHRAKDIINLALSKRR